MESTAIELLLSTMLDKIKSTDEELKQLGYYVKKSNEELDECVVLFSNSFGDMSKAQYKLGITIEQHKEIFEQNINSMIANRMAEIQEKRDAKLIEILKQNVDNALKPAVTTILNSGKYFENGLNSNIKREINKYKLLAYSFIGATILMIGVASVYYKKYDISSINDLKYRYLKVLPVSNTSNLTVKTDSIFRVNDFNKLEKAISEKENTK